MFVSYGEPTQAADDVSLSWQPFSTRLRYLTLASCSKSNTLCPLLVNCGRCRLAVVEVGLLIDAN